MDKKQKQTAFGLGIALTIFVASCAMPSPNGGAVPDSVSSNDSLLQEPIRPVPTDQGLNPDKVALGHQLFEDKRLSGDDTLSCSSCHGLDKGGTDQKVHSTGIGGAAGGINAPTVLNAGFNFVQFWNGRSPSLEDQVNGPTHNPKEMGSDWDHICAKLNKDDKVVADFQKLYHTNVTPEGIRDCIATFERSCATPNSPFDKYLKGDASALTEEQKHGYQLFKDYGCSSCHQGVNVGGNMYEKFGVMGDYFKDRGHETDADQGRFAVTKRPEDMHVFKVPTLRNIALTGPYFHDGSATTLPQAVEVMAQYQLGRPIEPKDLADIVHFLESLTGDQPGDKK